MGLRPEESVRPSAWRPARPRRCRPREAARSRTPAWSARNAPDDVLVLLGLARAGGVDQAAARLHRARPRCSSMRRCLRGQHRQVRVRYAATGSPDRGEACRAPSTGASTRTRSNTGPKGRASASSRTTRTDVAPLRATVRSSSSTRRVRTSPATSRPRSPMRPAIATVLPPGEAQASSTRSPGPRAGHQRDELRRLVLDEERPLIVKRRRERVAARRPPGPSGAKRVGDTVTPAAASRRGQFVARDHQRVGAQGERRRRVVEARPRPRRLEPVAVEPSFDEPARVRAGDREVVERRFAVLRGRPRRQRQVVPLPPDPPEHRVHERARAALARLPRHLHRVVDHRAGGHAVEVEELVGAEAEDVEHLRIEAASGRGVRRLRSPRRSRPSTGASPW